MKDFGKDKGLRVFDDLKKLDPKLVEQARALTGAADEDLLMIAGWPGAPQGHRPEETFYQACGQLRLHLGQKYNDRLCGPLLDAKQPEDAVGGRFSDVRVGCRREPLERGPSSVHFGASTKRHREADHRSARCRAKSCKMRGV